MSSMKDREEGFERKFAFDEELRFKASARRNKALGLWAAEKLGKSGADADAYAKEVVVSDIEEAGDHDAAAECYRDALSARPDFAEALVNLGHALEARGELGVAVREQNFDRDIAIQRFLIGLIDGRHTAAPDDLDALQRVGNRLRDMRVEWERPPHKPVAQQSMGAGTVELF